jgi:membrane associated rhomboid family serine protease
VGVSSGPDLFVVCKSCGSEVSPYVTECPYCGTRLRKRAPKLDRGGIPKGERTARRRPSLGRLRPGEIPGIRADRRPYVSAALVLAAIVVTLGARLDLWSYQDLWLEKGQDGEIWRSVTTLFVYFGTAYQVVTLACVFIFGWLLERRHGPWAPLLVFVLAGGGGMLAALAVGDHGVEVGGNGAALGLLAAWAMRDVLGRRRHIPEADDADLLGALAVAAMLICLPLVADEASALAGVAGGVIGCVLGLGLAQLRER